MANKAQQQPTAIVLLEKEVARFLASPTPEVLCIRGRWGVGKTYAWAAFLDSAKKRKTGIALKAYAYVSLFGVQDLEKLKHAIFENTISTDDIGTEASLKTLVTRANTMLDSAGRKTWASLLQVFGQKSISDVLQSVSFLTVSEQIICIDDLERKGAGLRTMDVLGLISFLTERRKCKVVLILNDEQLGPEKEELERYQEKVIDSSLLFAPTEEEAVNIALKDRGVAQEHLAQNCIALGISNIRVIAKINRLTSRLERILKKFDPTILKQAIQTLTLFGWAHFSNNEERTSGLIDFSIKKRGRGWYGETSENKLSEHEQTLDKLLDIYNFGTSDELDLTILDGIRAGFFDEDRMTRQATVLDQKIREVGANEALQASWEIYHESFDINDDEVVQKILKSFYDHVQLVSPNNFDSTIRLLKTLGHQVEATTAIAYYMQERKEDRDFFDFDQMPFGGDITDPDIRKSFDEKFRSFKDERDPIDVLESIGRDKSWSRDDVALLSALSPDDFKKIFKTLRGLKLRTVVRAALEFAKLGGDVAYQQIAAKAAQALKEIAKESPLNRMRVSRFGIQVDD